MPVENYTAILLHNPLAERRQTGFNGMTIVF